LPDKLTIAAVGEIITVSSGHTTTFDGEATA